MPKGMELKREQIGEIFKSFKVIGFIPARSGSKGIKNKNIVQFAGYPLVAHTILALKAAGVNEVYVSTDSLTIGRISEQYGGIYVDRPKSISGDNTPVEAAIERFVSKKKCDIIVFVQATSPMVTPDEIEEGIFNLVVQGYDSLFSAAKVNDMLMWTSHLHPLNHNPNERKMRQDTDFTLIETGGFYVFWKKSFMQHKNRICGKFGYSPVRYWNSFEIDTEKDLHCIERLIRKEII